MLAVAAATALPAATAMGPEVLLGRIAVNHCEAAAADRFGMATAGMTATGTASVPTAVG